MTRRSPASNLHVIRWLHRQHRDGRTDSSGPSGLLEALGVRVCPACGEPAVYSPPLDRYLHADGSSSDRCWRALQRGQRPYAPPGDGWQWEARP